MPSAMREQCPLWKHGFDIFSSILCQGNVCSAPLVTWTGDSRVVIVATPSPHQRTRNSHCCCAAVTGLRHMGNHLSQHSASLAENESVVYRTKYLFIILEEFDDKNAKRISFFTLSTMLVFFTCLEQNFPTRAYKGARWHPYKVCISVQGLFMSKKLKAKSLCESETVKSETKFMLEVGHC